MKYAQRTKKKHWRRIAVFCICGYLACLVLLVYSGTREELVRCDVAVVLGNEILPSGLPSLRLQARLDRAADLFNKGLCKEIIVSGGTGKEGFDEAAVMRDYLVQQGIPPACLIVDSAGKTTRATAEFTARYMADKNLQSAIAVSQYFHVPRVRLALRQAGVSHVTGAYGRYLEWRDFYSVQRELPAYLAYYLRLK